MSGVCLLANRYDPVNTPDCPVYFYSLTGVTNN